jgi:hypothetical protein
LFRHTVDGILYPMATLKQKIAAETKVRQLLEREGVAPPDRIEYGSTLIRLFWNGPKVVLVVDIDEFAEDLGNGASRVDVFPAEDLENGASRVDVFPPKEPENGASRVDVFPNET